jgi:hypothetical protein
MKKALYKTAKKSLRTYRSGGFPCEDCAKSCYNMTVGTQTMVYNLNRDS